MGHTSIETAVPKNRLGEKAVSCLICGQFVGAILRMSTKQLERDIYSNNTEREKGRQIGQGTGIVAASHKIALVLICQVTVV